MYLQIIYPRFILFGSIFFNRVFFKKVFVLYIYIEREREIKIEIRRDRKLNYRVIEGTMNPNYLLQALAHGFTRN